MTWVPQHIHMGLRARFDLNPPTAVQMRKMTRKQRRAVAHKERLRDVARCSADAIMTEWKRRGGLTREETKAVAFASLPWWKLLFSWGLRSFVSSVSMWVFDRLESASRED